MNKDLNHSICPYCNKQNDYIIPFWKRFVFKFTWIKFKCPKCGKFMKLEKQTFKDFIEKECNFVLTDENNKVITTDINDL